MQNARIIKSLRRALSQWVALSPVQFKLAHCAHRVRERIVGGAKAYFACRFLCVLPGVAPISLCACGDSSQFTARGLSKRLLGKQRRV